MRNVSAAEMDALRAEALPVVGFGKDVEAGAPILQIDGAVRPDFADLRRVAALESAGKVDLSTEWVSNVRDADGWFAVTLQVKRPVLGRFVLAFSLATTHDALVTMTQTGRVFLTVEAIAGRQAVPIQRLEIPAPTDALAAVIDRWKTAELWEQRTLERLGLPPIPPEARA